MPVIKNTSIYNFADDTAIFSTNTKLKIAARNFKADISKIVDWLKNKGIGNILLTQQNVITLHLLLNKKKQKAYK